MTTTSFRPAGPRILVRITEAVKELKSDGGIVLSSQTTENEITNLIEGIVEKIGESAWHDYPGEPWAKVGDTVRFIRYAGQRYDENGFVWCVLNDEDITMVKEITNE